MHNLTFHNIKEITIRKIQITNTAIQSINIKIISKDGDIEFDFFGDLPYPIISAEEDIPIVPIKNEEE